MFDVHSHRIEQQQGGFILAIEGPPDVPGASTYATLTEHPLADSFHLVPYITAELTYPDAAIIYMHPRRESWMPTHVKEILAQHDCKLVILDTFYRFHWHPQDYFDLCHALPHKQFVLAHGGGYQAAEFVEIARYLNHCYIDFSATQEIFDCFNPHSTLDIGIHRIIQHALTEPRIRDKVLFGSDNPEFNQAYAWQGYASMAAHLPAQLTDNFHALMRCIRG